MTTKKITDFERECEYAVFRYCKKIKLLSQYNQHINIPNDIINIIVYYYFDNYKLNKIYHSKSY